MKNHWNSTLKRRRSEFARGGPYDVSELAAAVEIHLLQRGLEPGAGEGLWGGGGVRVLGVEWGRGGVAGGLAAPMGRCNGACSCKLQAHARWRALDHPSSSAWACIKRNATTNSLLPSVSPPPSLRPRG